MDSSMADSWSGKLEVGAMVVASAPVKL